MIQHFGVEIQLESFGRSNVVPMGSRYLYKAILLLSLIAIMEVITSMSMSKQPNGSPATLTMGSNSILIKEQGRTLSVSLTCPEFVFERKTVGAGLTPIGIKGDIERQIVTASFSPIDLGGSARLEVKLHAEWSKKSQILSKWAEYRITGAETPTFLKEIALERLETPGQTVSVKSGQVQSYPVFMQAFFTGIEFPVAALRAENDRIVLAHRPGIDIQPNKWYESKKAIFGAAPVGQERQAFKQYIAAHRTSPTGFHIDYNSWWTSKVPYSEAEILGLMRTFKEKMFEPYKEHFDSFCIDMGWSEPKSFWDINTKLFPEKFTPLMEKAKEMKSNPGLWISPCNAYSPSSMDNDWAEEQGYEIYTATWSGRTYKVCCLGGPKYQTDFRDRLVEMVTNYGIRQIKFDGYNTQCPEPKHGHAPGEYSAEAIAEGMISTFRAIRQAAPDTWMETTCMGWNPSPWWLFYADSVIGTYGDDSPFGRVPCPVYRESYTTARDYYNLQGAALLPIPIVAQEVLGIIHQSPDPFMNDAVTTIMRGHMFLPVYLNPACMNDARWKTFAKILSWARKNEAILEETQPILPESWLNGVVPQFDENAEMPREPYGYAHFKGKSGLVGLRNPWITGRSYSLKLDASLGLSPDADGLSVVSLYPEVRAYGQNLRFGQTLNVPLAPYETLVLSVAPNQHTAGISPAADALHGLGKVNISRIEKTRVEFADSQEAFGPDWTSLLGNMKSAVRLNVEAKVEITAPQAELLVLVEGETPPTAPMGSIRINGVETKPVVTGSITGWAATQQPQHGHWTFLRVPLITGTNTIAIDLYAGTGAEKISAWVWAKKAGRSETADYKNALPEPEEISLQSVAIVEPFEANTVASPVVHADRPDERINGVFLDTIDPVSVTQGWGTLEKNRSVWEKPIIIAGHHYVRGLGTHAVSRIVYDMGGEYKRFQAWAGADMATYPTITFEVKVDGNKVWESGFMKQGDPAKFVDIDVTGKKTLELCVGDGGNGLDGDHADWAEAKLLK